MRPRVGRWTFRHTSKPTSQTSATPPRRDGSHRGWARSSSWRPSGLPCTLTSHLGQWRPIRLCRLAPLPLTKHLVHLSNDPALPSATLSFQEQDSGRAFEAIPDLVGELAHQLRLAFTVEPVHHFSLEDHVAAPRRPDLMFCCPWLLAVRGSLCWSSWPRSWI